MNTNFIFLSEEEVEDFSRMYPSEISEFYSTEEYSAAHCEPTDYALITGTKYEPTYNHSYYWLTKRGKTRSGNYSSNNNKEASASFPKKPYYSLLGIGSGELCNIRPALLFSTINKKDIIAEKIFARKYFKYAIMEYCEYPQTVETVEISKVLEDNIYKMRNTFKKYSSNICNLEEYEYMGKKYVRIVAPKFANGKILSDGREVVAGNIYWIRIEPIRWIVDVDGNIALSEKILFSIPFKKDSFSYRNIENFEESYPYDYLNNTFPKEIIPQKEYLKKYKDRHKDININLYKQLTEQEINSLFKGIDIFTPNINITLAEYDEELIKKIELLCPSHINLDISITNRKNEVLSNNIDNLCVDEINDLIKDSLSLISDLSSDIKTDVYNKLLLIIEDYNNKLEKLKDRILKINTEEILTIEGDDVNYLNLDLYNKLLYFIKMLNNKPHLTELLNNINNVLNYINNNSIENENNNKIITNLVNIIDISKTINNEASLIILGKIKDILNIYKAKISTELDTLISKDIKLILEEENYENSILNNLNNVWNNFIENKSLLLTYQLLNSKNLLLNNELNIISLNLDNDKGTSIQNKVIEISIILNNYSDDIKKEIINRINNYLNECVKKIKICDIDELSNKINKSLLELKFNLENKFNTINTTYSTPKIRIRNKI